MTDAWVRQYAKAHLGESVDDFLHRLAPLIRFVRSLTADEQEHFLALIEAHDVAAAERFILERVGS